jgi:hypothetical protein
MAYTHITDLTDFLDETGDILAEPAQSKALGVHDFIPGHRISDRIQRQLPLSPGTQPLSWKNSWIH